MTKVRHARKLLFLLIFFTCGELFAASNKATDAAFAALLSMPGGEPANGQWGTPLPNDFAPGTESALIDYLARKQKAGADFNAVRHRGTLLHHAIRAGKNQTAIWLLAHGADPKKTVADDGGGDALALSVTYKRTSLARLLQDKYGLTLPPPAKTPPHGRRAPHLEAPTGIDGARALLASVSWLGTVTRAPTPGSINTAKEAQEYRQTLGNWSSASAGMTPDFYAQVMDDDKAMVDLVILHSRSASALDQALARIPEPIIKRRAKATVAALARQSRMEINTKSKAIEYTLPADVWRTLWRHLGQPPDYGDSEWLAQRVQPELWHDLLASGYDGNRTELVFGCMLSEIGARDLKAMWPQLVANFPRIRQDAPSLVLAPFRFAGSNRCWERDAKATRDKLLFLTSVGVKAPVKGILQKRQRYAAPDLLAAMQPFVAGAENPGSAPPPRLMDAAAKCTFSLTDPWFRKLQEPTAVMGSRDDQGPVDIQTVQLVEIPGEAECGLLVGGYRNLDDLLLGKVEDRFTGPERNASPSCPDPQDRYAVWQNRQGTVVELQTDMGEDNSSPELFPVRDTLTGQRYYIHNGEQYGKCSPGERLPFTFEWRRAGKDWSLMRTDSEKHQTALFDQCIDDEEGRAKCRGIAALSVEPSDEAKPDPFKGMDIDTFLKTLGQGRHSEYLQAVAALDKAKLKEIRAVGVPAKWTAEAIVQVSGSDLPLAAKRARTAWIFADRLQLERAFNSEVFNALLPWLPREDWHPILNMVAKRPDYHRESFRVDGEGQAHADLACDIANALGMVCGESLSVD